MFHEINALLAQYDPVLQAHFENHEMDIEVSESKISCRLDDNPPNQHVMVILNFVIEMVHPNALTFNFSRRGGGERGEFSGPSYNAGSKASSA